MLTRALLAVVCFCGVASGATIVEECMISPNGDLSDPQPLVLQFSATPQVLYPNTHLEKSQYGGVKLYRGDEFELACPGTTFELSKSEVITATCVKNRTFAVDERSYRLESLKCSKVPEPTARWTETRCAGVHKLIEIGYAMEEQFLSLVRVCFDDDLKVPVYSEHMEEPSVYSYQRSYPRVDFQAGPFYKGVIKNIQSVYSIYKQREQVSRILGSKTLGDQYIGGTSSGYYMARGHLAAKADFVYGPLQSATFFYVNVVPQWQVFNAGNWAALEDSVRTFVGGGGESIIVYTGTHGVATLPDNHGVDQQLFLYTDSNNNNLVPVPKLMWKLLYSNQTSRAIVFVGVNNPYLTQVTDDYIICEDVCDQVTWLTWKQKNIKKGYSYCCEVDDFMKTVTSLPELIVKSLLK